MISPAQKHLLKRSLTNMLQAVINDIVSKETDPVLDFMLGTFILNSVSEFNNRLKDGYEDFLSKQLISKNDLSKEDYYLLIDDVSNKVLKQYVDLPSDEIDTITNKSQEEKQSFCDKFTYVQKGAILDFLYLIARADQVLHEKEDEYLKGIYHLLKIDASNQHLLPSECKNFEQMITVFNGFDIGQKEWLAIKATELIIIDGEVHEREIKYLTYVLTNIGISDKLYEEMLYINKLKKIN